MQENLDKTSTHEADQLTPLFTSGPHRPTNVCLGHLHEDLVVTRGGRLFREILAYDGCRYLNIRDVPVSARIRRRIQDAGASFFANDNISEFLSDDEAQELQVELERKVQGVLETLVIDTQNDPRAQDTTKHVTKLLTELYAGRYLAQDYVQTSDLGANSAVRGA